MFMEEARLQGLVRHPNVVGVFDVGEDDEGPFLVLELIDGQSLARILSALHERGDRLPVQVAVRIALEVARGLHAANEIRGADDRPLGLVHRDVSPNNILVGFDGSVRVTDFGIAKAIGNTSHTNTGLLKGNVRYLSPEQVRFEEPDRRSDLFSLGVVLFEMVTGRRLYAAAPGLEAARRILGEAPPDLGDAREVQPALVEVAFELLAKPRDRRPATAAAVVARLELWARLLRPQPGGAARRRHDREPARAASGVGAHWHPRCCARPYVGLRERSRGRGRGRPALLGGQLAGAARRARGPAAALARDPARRGRDRAARPRLRARLRAAAVGADRVAGAATASASSDAGRPARSSARAAHGVAGPFLSLAVGDVHSCARHLNGIACWGRNANLQVGDGTAEDRARPVSAGGFRGLDL
jgi:serine/threonine-protein kinase